MLWCLGSRPPAEKRNINSPEWCDKASEEPFLWDQSSPYQCELGWVSVHQGLGWCQYGYVRVCQGMSGYVRVCQAWAASSKQQAASSKQQAASSKQQAASSQQAAGSKQPTAASSQHEANSQQPADIQQQPAADSRQQAASSWQQQTIQVAAASVACLVVTAHFNNTKYSLVCFAKQFMHKMDA